MILLLLVFFQLEKCTCRKNFITGWDALLHAWLELLKKIMLLKTISSWNQRLALAHRNEGARPRKSHTGALDLFLPVWSTPLIREHGWIFFVSTMYGVVKNPNYCVAALFYSFKNTTCMASTRKKMPQLGYRIFWLIEYEWPHLYLLGSFVWSNLQVPVII